MPQPVDTIYRMFSMFPFLVLFPCPHWIEAEQVIYILTNKCIFSKASCCLPPSGLKSSEGTLTKKKISVTCHWKILSSSCKEHPFFHLHVALIKLCKYFWFNLSLRLFVHPSLCLHQWQLYCISEIEKEHFSTWSLLMKVKIIFVLWWLMEVKQKSKMKSFSSRANQT